MYHTGLDHINPLHNLRASISNIIHCPSHVVSHRSRSQSPKTTNIRCGTPIANTMQGEPSLSLLNRKPAHFPIFYKMHKLRFDSPFSCKSHHLQLFGNLVPETRPSKLRPTASSKLRNWLNATRFVFERIKVPLGGHVFASFFPVRVPF